MAEDSKKFLEQAVGALDKYNETTGCAWCKSTSEKLKKAIDDLISLQEYGEQFVKKLEGKKGFQELPEEAMRLATLRAIAEGKSLAKEVEGSIFSERILPNPKELFGDLIPRPMEIFEATRPPLPHELLMEVLLGGGK